MHSILTGALSRNDNKRMDKHAELFYEEVRHRHGDEEKIAKNTGFRIDDIKEIKLHMFFNKYDLGEDEPKRFDPDYDQAVSWQRLVEGKNIQEMDLILLGHELREYNLMKTGLSYDEAHIIANRTYDYGKYIDELDRKAGLL